MGFSNATMRAPTAKPHIAFINGWWRVSHMTKPFNPKEQQLFVEAHNFIRRKPGVVYSRDMKPPKRRLRWDHADRGWIVP